MILKKFKGKGKRKRDELGEFVRRLMTMGEVAASGRRRKLQTLKATVSNFTLTLTRTLAQIRKEVLSKKLQEVVQEGGYTDL